METEINPAALENLIQKIAVKYCSEADRNNFAMTGNLQIELALEGKYNTDKITISDSDAFGISEAKMVIEIASLIAGSVKAFFEIKKLKNNSLLSDNAEEVKTRWKKKLVDEGVDSEKADSIVEEFHQDVKSVFA